MIEALYALLALVTAIGAGAATDSVWTTVAVFGALLCLDLSRHRK